MATRTKAAPKAGITNTRRPIVVALALLLGFLLTFTACPAFAQADDQVRQDALSIYHEGWRLVKETYMDAAKLAEVHWDTRQAIHDDEIHTIEDAGKFLTLELKNLDTIYTRYLTPEQAREQSQNISGTAGSIGIEIAPAADPKDKSKCLRSDNGDYIPAKDANGYPLIEKVFLGTPAEHKLQPGDAISLVDGNTTKTLTQEDMLALIDGNPGTAVKLQFVRKGHLYATTIVRAEIDTAPLYVRNLPDGITYIRIVSFIGKDVPDKFLRILLDHQHSRGFIIDVRNNSGGLLQNAQEMAGYLLPSNKALMREEQRDTAGGITPSITYVDDVYHGEEVVKGKPIVVLVNEDTASASEIFAGALADNDRALLVGTKTYGKGCVQQINMFFEGRGGAINITVANYLTPNGTWPGDGEHKRKGVLPKPENTVTLSEACPIVEDVVGASDKVDLDQDAQLKTAFERVNSQAGPIADNDGL